MNLLGLLECSGTHQGLIGNFPESFYRSSGAFLGLYISFPGPFFVDILRPFRTTLRNS